MASSRAVAIALATFHEAFPTREITSETTEVWSKLLTLVSDERLASAVLFLCRDPARRFFPSSGEVFAAIAKGAQPVNALAIIHRIEKLGFYNPGVGWVYPTTERVREALGDEIANAYTIAGPERMFAPDEASAVTRDIARRKFEERVQEAQRTSPGQLLLPAPVKDAVSDLQPEMPRERAPQFLGAGRKSPLMETIARVVAAVEIETEQETLA